MYDALDSGHVDVPRLRQVLAGLPQSEAANGRLVLAVDVTRQAPEDARLTVLDRRRAGGRPDLVDRAGGRDPVGPGHARAGPRAVDLPASGRAPAQVWRRVRLRAARDLGRGGGRDCGRHGAVRDGDRPGVGPAAPPADPAGGVARPRGLLADHRGHRDPAVGGETA
ncbi:hypothetical protein ACIQ7D_05160 [Streptomyces sp. NPDC096310]|uniref:hypothetical protein n=1 Tax=Streptomyces sp. NPDC096310 TaxID=3366082 RepID=UPI0037FE7F5C